MAARRNAPDFELEFQRYMGPEYDDYLGQVKERIEAGFDPHGMTEPELVALYVFTTSGVPWGHHDLNQAHWAARQPGGPEVPRRYEVYRLTLNAALNRLPDHPAKGLLRGIDLSPEEIARYVPGQIVIEEGFISTGIDKGFKGGAQFRIDGLHGKHIEQLSAHPDEREVLFKVGTRFRVIKKHEENGTTYIELEEVDDD